MYQLWSAPPYLPFRCQSSTSLSAAVTAVISHASRSRWGSSAPALPCHCQLSELHSWIPEEPGTAAGRSIICLTLQSSSNKVSIHPCVSLDMQQIIKLLKVTPFHWFDNRWLFWSFELFNMSWILHSSYGDAFQIRFSGQSNLEHFIPHSQSVKERANILYPLSRQQKIKLIHYMTCSFCALF